MIRLFAQVACILGLLVLLGQAGSRTWNAYTQPQNVVTAGAAPTQQTPTGASEGEPLEFKGRELAAYPETASRPVFFEGRRYPEMIKAAAPVPPAPVAAPAPATTRVSVDGIKLRGVMIRDGNAQALIEVASQPPTWVAVGEKVQAWTVQVIRSNSVRLGGNSNGQFATVSLYEYAAEN